MNKNGRPRVYCYKQQQASKCKQRSTFLDICEAQIADHPSLFELPADYRRQILTLHAAHCQRAFRGAQVEQRLQCIKELFGWGDMEREAYLTERDSLQQKLAALRDDESAGVVIEAAATLLHDMKASWAAATPEQRNDLARLLFREIRIRDDAVVVLVPAPELAPFFCLAGYEELLSSDDKKDSPACQDCPKNSKRRK